MIKIARFTYLIAIWIFFAGTVVQFFLAGLVVDARLIDWKPHVALGIGLWVLPIVMFIAMFLGRLPSSVKWLTFSLFIVISIQSILVWQRGSVVSALHPVMGLFDFAIAWLIIQRTRDLLSKEAEL